MTTALLLSIIATALGLQLAVAIGVGLSRRRHRPVVTPPEYLDTAESSRDLAWRGWRDFRVARREFEDEGATQCSFYLEPVDGVALPPFRPGQFLTFSLPVRGDVASRDTAPRTLTRCYSLSDRPHADHYRITVKRVPPPPDRPELPPGAASNLLHDRVTPGTLLRVKAPSGHFFIDAESDTPVVLIGGGIGVTPMMSMLRWLLDEQPARVVHLFLGVRRRAEHPFKELLELLAEARPQFHLHVIYGTVDPDTDVVGRDYHHAGFITIQLLRDTLPAGRHQFYVCGPSPMMESIVPALEAWGVAPSDVHFEAFGPASIRSSLDTPVTRLPSGVESFDVQFRRTGRTVEWDGADETLLDFAERHGVVVDSGCRTGGCGSCETTVISGSVGYSRTPDHDVAPGRCLLCVGTPQSPLVLDA